MTPKKGGISLPKKYLIIASIFVFFLVSGFWYFLQEDKGITKEQVPSSVFSQTQQQDNTLKEEDSIQEKSQLKDSLTEEGTKETEAFIFVYVCGAVKNTGVYSLVEGDRLYMAIELAGGFTEEAAKEYHNLARMVEDGERIYILTKKELEELSIEEQIAGELGVDAIAQQQVVNLNTADVEELTTLPGIGESKAKLIIEYRTKVGKFKSIEELMNISGIGEAMFEKVKDKVTIE